MPDYQQGKIYKIVNLASNDEHDCYVGSTCVDLAKRFGGHKDHWKRNTEPNRVLYQAFTEHGIDNFRIVLLEVYACGSKHELIAKEEEYRVLICPNYNMKRCFLTDEELKKDRKQYRIDNTEKVAEMDKKYYNNNKEVILEYKRSWYEANKERLLKQSKEKRQQHPELNREKCKKYREANEEKINQHKRQEFTCECGSTIQHTEKARHFRSIKHIRYLESKNNQAVN